jgi:hypothetical protein
VVRNIEEDPRVMLHFTLTSGSWLNMVEIFFSIITRQAIRRGTFTSVKDLIAAIETFIDGWNERCQPFNTVRWSSRWSSGLLRGLEGPACVKVMLYVPSPRWLDPRFLRHAARGYE